MKYKNLLVLLVSALAPSFAAAQCTNCAKTASSLPLPPQALSGITNPKVSISLTDTLTTIDFTVQFSGLPSGYAVGNQSYTAICGDFFGAFADQNLNVPYTLISTYNTAGLPANGQSPNWDKVNWILNHQAGHTSWAIQQAVWRLLAGQYAPTSAGFPLPEPETDNLYNQALTSGVGFVPPSGGVVGVLMYVDGIYPYPGQNGQPNVYQDLLLEVPMPECGTGAIGDFVWNDTNNNGLQDTGEPGINGVTVKLEDSSGNVLSTAVTANAPAGYPNLSPASAGYYQFTGLCHGTYQVVIDNTQPSLANFTPSPTLVGPNRSVDSNSNPSTVTLTTDIGVDETIDFGYHPKQAPPLTLTCSASTGRVGVPYSSALVATGGVSPYTFAIVSGTLPPGFALNPANGAITGTSFTPGVYNFTAQVTDSSGNSTTGKVQKSCSITISNLALTCASSAATLNSPYSSALVASGGVAPYNYAIIAGSLPPGLSLNPATGAITGTPTAAGTYNFTARAVDSSGNAATNTVTSNCTMVVTSVPLHLSCPANTGRVNVPYSSTLTATGGVKPYTFSVIGGSLPTGLSLNPTTGAITGTPQASGTFTTTFRVMDSSGVSASNTASTTCNIVISPPPPPSLMLSCAASSGTVASPYSSALVATGGVAPYSFSIVSGTLPPGLSLNTSTGAITGTPSSEGSFNFTAKVVDSSGNPATNSTTSNCTITIKTCGTSLVPVTYNVHEDQGAGEIAWFNSHLTGLGGAAPSSPFQIFITGGKITFGPSTLSVPDAVISFTSSASCASTSFNSSLNRWETTVPLSEAKADEIFAAGLAYLIPSGFPQNVNNVTWSADISSTVPGLQVTWQYGVSNWKTTGFPTLSSSPFVPDYTGMQVFVAHGQTNCYGTSGDHAGAPEFSGRGNVLTGGGSGGGGSNWTGSWSSTPGKVSVCQPPIPGLTPSCPASSGQQNAPYTSSFGASGGVAPYTFAVTSGSLPPGLSFNASTGAITGTPTAAGTYSFTVKVTDSSGTSASRSCSITITGTGPAPSLTLVKSASSTTVKAFATVTYTYKVTNNGALTLNNIVITDDNGTPGYTADDFTVGTVASLAPGASATLTATVYPPISLTIVDQKAGTIPGGMIIVQNVTNPPRGGVSAPNNPAGGGTVAPNGGSGAFIKVTFLQSLGLNDNSYGTNSSPAWANHGHKFQDLTGSDQAQFQFFDTAGNLVLDFNLDYISSSTAYPSGYGSLGYAGGDGKFKTGNQAYVVNWDSTLADDLNQSSAFYGFTTNSPAAGASGWNFVDGYYVTIDPAAFGSNGFGRVAIPQVHNSPSINGTDQPSEIPAPSTVTNTATASTAGFSVTATAVINIQP